MRYNSERIARSSLFYGRTEADRGRKKAGEAELQAIVQKVNEQAAILDEGQKRAAMAKLLDRCDHGWLNRRKKDGEADNITSAAEAAALLANSGHEVTNIRQEHRSFGSLDGNVYYIDIKGSNVPFVVRCDTGAVYDGRDFDTQFPKIEDLLHSGPYLDGNDIGV